MLEARGLGGYALLTTERALAAAPRLEHGASAVLVVPSGSVPDAAAAVRDEVGGRPVAALGGGRVIDSAKAIAGAEGLRCAALPTTLSGAEMTHFHRMPAGVERFALVRPALVIAEPELMASQPMPALAASAMNALAHAIEALYTPLANPVGDLAALRAIQLIGNAFGEGEPLRRDLALGALLAGYASDVAGFAVHHAVCQTIVRECGTPHAQTNAVMLPHTMRLMGARAARALGLVASALGPDGDPDAAVARVSDLAALAGVRRLSELGVDELAVDRIVAVALEHPALGNTLRAPAERELRDLLEQAL